jgi:hypothetical protein
MSSPQPTQPLPPLAPSSAQIQSGFSYISWLYPQIGGQFCPGTLLPGEQGLKGFERKTGWDIKAGKGTKGATLTLKDLPPVKGTITMRLLTANDLADYDSFVANVLSTDNEDQQAEGLSYFYPGHMGIGLTTIVIEGWKLQPMRGGVLHLVIDVIEWSQPPATSIVSTVVSTGRENSTVLGPAGTSQNQPSTEHQRDEAEIAAIYPLAYPGAPAP